MKRKKIGILVGSLRKGSYARSVANWVTKNPPASFDIEIIEIGDLSLYNQDFDEKSPESYVKFRNSIQSKDAYIFVTPEYNRSIPAVLKNALDIASRPYGQNVWEGKPAGIISHSIGNIGGFGANHHLRQVLSFLNVYTMQQPECYLSNITESINEKGELTSSKTIEFLKSYIDALSKWIDRF